MVKVMYRDYIPDGNEEEIVIETFKSWDIDGDYTYFYDTDSNFEKAKIIIPTHAICWIKP